MRLDRLAFWPTSLSSRFKRLFPRHMIVLAVFVGLVAGYGAVGFRLLVGLVTRVWPVDHFDTASVSGLPWYVVVAIPAAGGLLVGAITRYFAPEAKGHGVPEVMEAVALRGGAIRPRVVAAKALASSACIASGGSVGREGPIAQIGAAIGSTVGQLLHMEPRKLRTLVGCGAGAGIAATFNAPVAGALFAVEILLGDFAVHQFSPIVISSVVATVVSREYLGDSPAFEIPGAQLDTYRLVNAGELVAYAGLGVLAGLLAITFVRTLCFAEDRADNMRVPLPILTACGGALVGCIALAYPGILGVGYESITRSLVESQPWQWLAGLLVAKLLAVCITLGSGGSGGVFAPSLFLGAMLGGLIGNLVHWIAPGLSAPVGAYALVGMGSVVAATTRAPITTILIVFELTSDYRIMLPLMTSCIIATQIARRYSGHSIYTIKLARRGVTIRGGQDVDILRAIPVREVIRTAPTVAAATTARELVDRVLTDEARSLYVVDEPGRLCGVVSMRELKPVLRDPDVIHDLILAVDIASSVRSVNVSENLDSVLKQLDTGYRDELPVLEDDRLVGIVRVEDILSRYRAEIARRDVAAESDGAW